MQTLLPPRDTTELEPETQATVQEVCDAVEWFHPDVPDSVEYARALGFGEKWLTALRNTGDAGCRQKIMDAMEVLVRTDDELFISASPDGKTGPIYTRDQIAHYQGRLVYERQPDGQMVRILQWPVAFFASGQPCYDRGDKAA